MCETSKNTCSHLEDTVSDVEVEDCQKTIRSLREVVCIKPNQRVKEQQS